MARITKRYCEGRKSPYQLDWIEQGKRMSRFFETEELRDEFLRLNGFLEKQSFEALMSLDDNTIADIARIDSLRGETSFKEIWEFWAKHHKAKRVVTLWDACDEYIRDMQENDKADKEHIRHVRRILETLVETFGDRFIYGELQRNWKLSFFDIEFFDMSFLSEIKSALHEIFASFSQPVVWRGRTLNAIIAEGQQAVELESGGFVPDENFTVKFLESELDGEYPNLGEIVEYNNKQYRIHWVSVRANRGQIEVSLRAIDR